MPRKPDIDKLYRRKEALWNQIRLLSGDLARVEAKIQTLEGNQPRGGYAKSSVTREAILEALPATTTKIAELSGLQRYTCRYHLDRLRDLGLVRLGAQGVWQRGSR